MHKCANAQIVRIKTLNEDDAFYNLLFFYYKKKTDEVHIYKCNPK